MFSRRRGLQRTFCAPCALFDQRDTLWWLLVNADYVFSIVQVAAFIMCLADTVRWESTRATLY